MCELIAERAWLTVFLLTAYSPDLDTIEAAWAHVKRSMSNSSTSPSSGSRPSSATGSNDFGTWPDTLGGFTAGTGLTADTPTAP